jgi:hypothetical protein
MEFVVLYSIDKSVETTNKELIVIIKPDGLFELDLQVTEEQIDKDQIVFQEEIYRRFMEDADEALLYLGFSGKTVSMSESLGYLKSIASNFVKKLSMNPDIELLREKIFTEIEIEEIEYLLQSAAYLNGAEYLNENWIEKVWERLNHAFSKMIQNYKGRVEDFFLSYNRNVRLVGRVFFHLVESQKEEYPFAFLATYSADVSKDGKSKHLPLKNALAQYGKNSRKLLELLSTVNKASEKSAFIAELVESGEIFYPIGLSTNEAYTFLKEIPIYEEAGILCRIPNWWRNKSNSLKMAVSVGNRTPSILNFDALVDFNAELSLGGESISINELKKLLSEAEGLALIKGKWVEVNHERL